MLLLANSFAALQLGFVSTHTCASMCFSEMPHMLVLWLRHDILCVVWMLLLFRIRIMDETGVCSAETLSALCQAAWD